MTLRGTGMDSLYIISILDWDVMEVSNNAFIHGILIIPNPILTMTEQEQVDKYSALINPIKCLKWKLVPISIIMCKLEDQYFAMETNCIANMTIMIQERI